MFSLVMIIACDNTKPDCTNTNPVFDTNAPDSNLYRQDLAIQLLLIDKKKLSYWFKTYIEKDSETYLLVDIVGPHLCAEGYILVKDWSEPLDHIRRTKGKGYHGAELKGLEFTVNKDGTLVYKGLDKIID